MSPTYPGRNTQGFASLLDRILLREKGGPTVREVAAATDSAESTIYDYCRGRLTSPPDLIADFYRSCRHDRRILDFFLAELGIVWFELPECTGDLEETLFGQVIRAHEEFLDVLRAATASLKDGKVTSRELRNLREETWEAMGELAKLLACFEAEARKAPRR